MSAVRSDVAPRTLVEALQRLSEEAETGIRILDRREEAEWRSWREIRRRGLQVAGGLASSGIEPGDRVALIFPTSWGFLDAFFGTLLAGAVPVPLYPPVRLGRLEEYHQATARMVDAAGARLLLVDRRVRRLLGEVVRRSAPRLGARALDEILPGPGARSVEVTEDSLALVQFSSGTTMDPKPVALSHRAVMSQVVSLNRHWPDDELVRHRGVSWLPLYHDMGLIGCIFPALERPTDLTLLPPELFVARPASWLRAISRYRATVSPAPNFAYGLCVKKVRDEEMEGVDLSGWRIGLNGAETVSPRVVREFRDRFARWGLRPETVSPVYGLSEAALAVTFSALDREFSSLRVRPESLGPGCVVKDDADGQEIASVGRPLPGFEIEIRRADGSRCAEREVGRLWIRGPSLMEGYLDLPEATAEVMQEGWLDTGDLGFLADGELYLAGRAKDLVIVRGRNYAPEYLERAVDRLPGVRRGCVAAVSTLIEGAESERVLLFVERDASVRKNEIDALEERCRETLVTRTGLVSDEVRVLEPGTLPRTSSGKIRRAETLRRHLCGELRPPEKVSWWLLTRELVRSRRALSARAERSGIGEERDESA